MSRGVNKVILVGTCGQDPDVRYLPNGNAATNLSLATSEQWTDKRSGVKVERTEWHRVSLFGKVAEIAGEYLRTTPPPTTSGAPAATHSQSRDAQPHGWMTVDCGWWLAGWHDREHGAVRLKRITAPVRHQHHIFGLLYFNRPQAYKGNFFPPSFF